MVWLIYTYMQLCMGGEIIVGNSHASFTLFPKSSMFVKVGNSVPTKKKCDSAQMTDTVINTYSDFFCSLSSFRPTNMYKFWSRN